MKKVISSILCVCLAFLCFAGTKTEVSAAPAESLGASEACAGHTLGTFSGVPACVDSSGNLHVCENNFPDKNFRDYINQQSGGDGYFTLQEVNNVTTIFVRKRHLQSLCGVEFFNNLSVLECNDNQLTRLNISNNTALNTLNCNNNQLTELDLSKNTALVLLHCSGNQLTKIDISNNTALSWLNCSKNFLTELDLSHNTELGSLYCWDNQITKLDLSKNMKLSFLYCYNNQLMELDLSNYNIFYEISVGSGDSEKRMQNVSLFTRQENEKWIVNLSEFFSTEHLRQIEVEEAEGISYDPQTGIITYSSEPIPFIYFYATGYEDVKMQVQVTPVICNHPNAVWQTQTPATCTETGTESEICPDCGEVLNTKDIPANGHSFGTWETITAPTCTEKGSEQRTCSVCKEVETRDIDATGHSWETEFTIDKEPTATEDGSKSIHCMNCDAVKDVTLIPATGTETDPTNPSEPTPPSENPSSPNGTESSTTDNPSNSSESDVPQTGDSFPVTVLIVFFVAAGALTVLLVVNKKRVRSK